MERNWIYRDEVGSEYGPYSRDELERYAREGRVSAQGQIQDPDGNWIPATSAGLEIPEMEAANAPAHATPAQSSAEAIHAAHAAAAYAPSTNSRVAYILLGILLPLCPGIAGINNLVVGRTGPGMAQLILSVIALFFNVIGAVVGVTVCIGLPIYFGVLIWSIIEACTNERDGQGRLMV